jgi:phospholipase C
MLILTYDEHGGFWDSVPTKKTVPNPYPESKGWPHLFDFDRLGVRVPSIIISPWVAHSVQEDTYDHATVPATIKSLLQLSSPYLTSRDAAAQHFVTSETLLSKPRKDCPLTLPDVSPTLEEYPLEAMVDSSDNNRPHTIN